MLPHLCPKSLEGYHLSQRKEPKFLKMAFEATTCCFLVLHHRCFSLACCPSSFTYSLASLASLLFLKQMRHFPASGPLHWLLPLLSVLLPAICMSHSLMLFIHVLSGRSATGALPQQPMSNSGPPHRHSPPIFRALISPFQPLHKCPHIVVYCLPPL